MLFFFKFVRVFGVPFTHLCFDNTIFCFYYFPAVLFDRQVLGHVAERGCRLPYQQAAGAGRRCEVGLNSALWESERST